MGKGQGHGAGCLRAPAGQAGVDGGWLIERPCVWVCMEVIFSLAVFFREGAMGHDRDTLHTHEGHAQRE